MRLMTNKRAEMPEGSEFQTEGQWCWTEEGKGCADRRNRQQIGVGGAQRTCKNV